MYPGRGLHQQYSPFLSTINIVFILIIIIIPVIDVRNLEIWSRRVELF
jgi:hypothetical protein